MRIRIRGRTGLGNRLGDRRGQSVAELVCIQYNARQRGRAEDLLLPSPDPGDEVVAALRHPLDEGRSGLGRQLDDVVRHLGQPDGLGSGEPAQGGHRLATEGAGQPGPDSRISGQQLDGVVAVTAEQGNSLVAVLLEDGKPGAAVPPEDGHGTFGQLFGKADRPGAKLLQHGGQVFAMPGQDPGQPLAGGARPPPLPARRRTSWQGSA